MKIKTITQTIVFLWVSSMLIACEDKKTLIGSPGSVPPITATQAIDKLSSIGDRLATGPISEADEILIENLAKTPIPNFVSISNNVALTTVINHVEGKVFSTDPRTGQRVASCGNISTNKYNDIEFCDKTLLNLPEALRTAINISEPIVGELVVAGMKNPIKVKYIVEVSLLTAGSDCTTTIATGDATETCSKRPNRRRR